MLLYGCIKQVLSLLYLHPYLRQVGQLKGRTVFVYQLFYIKPVELQVVIIINVKAFLWKVKGLVYEVSICIVHL